MLRFVDADGYRSYVIRVRRRAGPGPDPEVGSTTRLDLEDLLAGGTASVSGPAARLLAERLERLLGAEDRPAPNDGFTPPEGGLADDGFDDVA